MASPENGAFSYNERILVAPLSRPKWESIIGEEPLQQERDLAPSPFVHVQLESSMTLVEREATRAIDAASSLSTGSVTPFPQEAVDLLKHHNATSMLLTVGTSSSHTFGIHPLDNYVDETSRRLDLGPSGVLVRATFSLTHQQPKRIMESYAKAQFEALLHDLVAQRILLAPLFSVSIRRLHRHVVSYWSESTTNINHQMVTYELVLPMEEAALSSEGMHAFATAFAPCHNQSGIFAWNDPLTTSEFFVKRNTVMRHSWWIQVDLQEQETQPDNNPNDIRKTTTTRIIKGLQFQPSVKQLSSLSSSTSKPKKKTIMSKENNRTVALADIFPKSIKHRSCPFVQEATLEAVLSPTIQLLSLGTSKGGGDEEEKTQQSSLPSHIPSIEVLELNPKNWSKPFIAILGGNALAPSMSLLQQQQQQPRWSVHQTIQRPRGVANWGRLITEVNVLSSRSLFPATADDSDCHLVVDLQWFLPPVVQPTWQSLRVVWERTSEKVEQQLDWRHDLDGRIQFSHGDEEDDDAAIHFHIPQWNVTTTSSAALNAEHKLTVYMEYEPAFLSFEHFPGDANRGVEIPPAVASFVEICPAHSLRTASTPSSQPIKHVQSAPITLYSNSLLLMPPVPDMSMPFNVLSMTCSLYAFVIGSLLNLLIRKSSERIQRDYDPSNVPPPSKLQLLKTKVRERLSRILGRNKEKERASVEDEKAETPQVGEGTQAHPSATQKDATNTPEGQPGESTDLSSS